MTNEEKKQFIIDAYKLYMKHRPYDVATSTDNVKKNEDEFWSNYYSLFYDKMPKSLYKYRKIYTDSLKCLENDEAWFSHPKDFDDTVDSTLNNDIEEELDDFEKNPQKIKKELSKAFINVFASKYGVSIDMSMVDEGFPLFNEDGTINDVDVRKYLSEKMPEYETDECIKRLKINSSGLINEEVQESVKGFLKTYLGMNDRVRSESLTFSLAEENDNQAMWGLYADESKGFCIEYYFSPNDFLGQRMLLNLFPIYYGDKPLIKFIDVLIRGIYSINKINGIPYEDYQEWFLSTFTKDKSYEFQKEWRITFDKTNGGNLQKFPFIKSIILGERISEENAKKLIDIVKKKNILIYQRKINKSGSKIIVEKIV